jgi:uncharacterized protein
MTRQERQLVDELFERLANLESMPRDPDAERLIADGTKRAPHAVYALVQTALVQDEALKRANARIEELQARLSGEEEQHQQQGGFLDSMRDAVLGQRASRGSVPTVRSRATQSSFAGAPDDQSQAGFRAPGAAPPVPYPTGPASGSGGSFLGAAASTAAGVIGGALLLDGIRSMFGHHSGLTEHDHTASGNIGDKASPWGGSAADSSLARDAGIDHIGDDRGAGSTPAADHVADLSDTADDRTPRTTLMVATTMISMTTTMMILVATTTAPITLNPARRE